MINLQDFRLSVILEKEKVAVDSVNSSSALSS